ncbi:MAG: hypothetical protein AAF800_01620 [Planctomycetota bacterium]
MTDRSAMPLAVALLLTAVAAGGCSPTLGGDGRSLSQHNDELRASNLALSRQVEASEKQIAGLESELRAHRQRAADGAGSGGDLPEGVVVPVFAGLDLGRYSGPVDTDGDGAADELRLYVKPTDQRGRTLVVAGSATVQVLQLGAAGPEVLARRSWDPTAWDTAYRSGFTGDHYTLSLPLPAGLAEQRDAVDVHVELTQASTGVARGASAAYPLGR